MSKTVLLDLDDTLLGNAAEPFTLNYLSLLTNFMRERLGFQDLSQPMLAGIRAVFNDRDPLRTNWDVFFDALEGSLAVPRAAFDAAVEAFYRDAYPSLQAGTTLRPGARRLVGWLLAQGYTVVVATNPFFPRVAVEQRLAWAGCAVDEHAFALVTTLENMHFTKPRLEYYEEILARVGAHAADTIMVGDDWERDIVPAWEAGLHTFWVVGDEWPSLPVHPTQPDAVGTLDDLAQSLERADWLGALPARPLAPQQIAPRLLANVAALAGIVRDAPVQVWTSGAGDGEAGPLSVLGELVRDEREVHRPALTRLGQPDSRLLPDAQDGARVDRRAMAADAWRLVEAFAAERRATLDVLESLESGAWEQAVEHPDLGAATLLESAERIARRERQQFARLRAQIAACP